MKKILKVLLLILIVLPLRLYAQKMDIEKTFPFGKPFNLVKNWDKNEGPYPGISGPMYFDDKYVFFVDYFNDRWFYFDRKLERKESPFASGPSFIGTRHIVSFSYAKNGHKYNFKIYERDGPFEHPLITLDHDRSLAGFYLTKNFLFVINGIDNSIELYELNYEKGIASHFSKEKTEERLKGGLAESLGYSIDENSHFPHKFGSNMVGLPGWPVIYNLTKFRYDEKKARDLDMLDEFNELSIRDFLGKDKKGNFYFISPFSLSGFYSAEGITQHLVVANPWTKSIALRSFPKKYWTPPGDMDNGVYGRFGRSISPEGDFYFWDADEEFKEYQLKRIRNDWWVELGADKQTICQVTDNQVRIRKEPKITSAVLGYLYDLEYALVLEKGNKEEEINGLADFWYKIKTWDDREGWMFGAFLKMVQ